jgi:hypothetical protein
MPDLLAAVSQWRQEAAQEDAKYLYERPDFHDLLTGEKFIVSGRKGAGKTATLNYIDRHCRATGIPHRHLSSRDLDFQALEDLSRNPAQAEGFWREVILSTAIELLNETYLRDQELGFVAMAARTVSEIVSYLKENDFNISYKGLTLIKPKSMNWQDRAIASKRFLDQLAPRLPHDAKIFITFDRLDTAFRYDATLGQMTAYLRLVEALLSATQAIHEINPFGARVSVIPIVLIRSDILALVANNDKTKWKDDTIELVWSPGEIRLLLAHRISADLGDSSIDHSDFAANWDKLFERFTIKDRYENGREKSSFEWIEFRTTWSPRDYIFYLRECARFSHQHGEKRISFDRMVFTEFNYSSYFRSQLSDEGLPHVPDIRNHLEQLSKLAKDHPRKRNFTFDEFLGALGLPDNQTGSVLDTLYQLNAIGNLVDGTTGHSHNRYKFKYKDKFFGALDKHGDIVFHPGLHRSLV